MRNDKLYSHPASRSATLVLTRLGHTYFVDSVLSSLPASDLVLYSVSSSQHITTPPGPTSSSGPGVDVRRGGRNIRTLPVYPYPALENTPTRVHLVSFPGGTTATSSTTNSVRSKEALVSWSLGDKSFGPIVQSGWIKGSVLGYRDRAGREALVSFRIFFFCAFAARRLKPHLNALSLTLNASFLVYVRGTEHFYIIFIIIMNKRPNL